MGLQIQLAGLLGVEPGSQGLDTLLGRDRAAAGQLLLHQQDDLVDQGEVAELLDQLGGGRRALAQRATQRSLVRQHQLGRHLRGSTEQAFDEARDFLLACGHELAVDLDLGAGLAATDLDLVGVDVELEGDLEGRLLLAPGHHVGQRFPQGIDAEHGVGH